MMKRTYILLLTSIAVVLTSCSGGGSAKTRTEKENDFKKAFSFSPSSSIVSIEYADLSNRGVIDCAYAQWIKFTYEEETFQKIISSGYTKDSSSNILNNDASPSWWPNTVNKDSTLYSRDHDDTVEDEGFSFREYLWYDDSTSQVFYYKFYWD